jgi:hypothetical protein
MPVQLYERLAARAVVELPLPPVTAALVVVVVVLFHQFRPLDF